VQLTYSTHCFAAVSLPNCHVGRVQNNLEPWIALNGRWEMLHVHFIPIINQLDALIFHIYFWNKTLHVSDSSAVHHHEFFTVHTVKNSRRWTAELSETCRVLFQKYIWEISASSMYSVQWKTCDDGQRNCPKHVEFYSKNTFEKLVHLVCTVFTVKNLWWWTEELSETCRVLFQK